MREPDHLEVVDGVADRFDRLVADIEPRLRRALVAAYGTEVGREATADALAWAWEHFDRIEAMSNAAGYLYRVGQSSTRRDRRHRERTDLRVVDGGHEDRLPIEPGLADALAVLTPPQRAAVLLVEGWGLTLQETADAMGARVSTVRTHRQRALDKLRSDLGVDP